MLRWIGKCLVYIVGMLVLIVTGFAILAGFAMAVLIAVQLAEEYARSGIR